MNRVKHVVLAIVAAASVVGGQASQRPVFRSGTDVVLVDVQVVTRTGEPIEDLGLQDFEIEIGGNERRIVSVDFFRSGGGSLATGVAPVTRASTGSDDLAQPRRLYILAVDESSFSTLAALAWKEAIKRFVGRLQPTDLVGLYAYPMGGSLVPLTTDHQAVIDAADRIVGRLDPVATTHYMSLSEMLDITRGDPDVALRVARRECAQTEIMWCANIELPREAQAFGREVELRMAQSIGGLRTLMRSLRDLEERKTVVVVSGGLFAADQIGGRGDVNDLISAVGHEAAHANINLYVLHLDRNFIEAFSSKGRASVSVFRDAELLGRGLDRFAGIAGGELIRVQAGTGDHAFERVLLETSAYYIVGVEPEPEDRDGRPHHLIVKVSRRNAIVRSRAWVVIPQPKALPLS